MRYLDDHDVERLGIDWIALTRVLAGAVESLAAGDTAQPVKPYLRYGNLVNRIIAMPAYVGGATNMAGLKWIASFPGNIDRGLQRAHSVTLLNEAETGVPLGVMASARLSGIRTAGVSALMLQAALPMKQGPLRIGMTGYGPIGQLHADMLFDLIGDRIERLRIFDLRGVDEAQVPARYRDRVEVVGRWEEAFESDVFVTCTVSRAPYVNLAPVAGSLQLNVSLRDYEVAFARHVRFLVVDDWAEVCRENTDVHRMHTEGGLSAVDTVSLPQVLVGKALSERAPQDVVMFNPMGMAVFDVAVAAHYLHLAEAKGVGTLLSRR